MDYDKNIYINRELSWLKFNERVLEEAEDSRVPLLERLKFVSIFASNLDEYYMVRVGSLYDQSLFNQDKIENKCRMTPVQQLNAVFEATPALLERKDAAWKSIVNTLEKEGISRVNIAKLLSHEKVILEQYYKYEIRPLISPQIVDKHHAFPFLKNADMYVGLYLTSGKGGFHFGIIPVSPFFERVFFFKSGDVTRFALIEDIILYFSDGVFKSHEMADKAVFRITRNADITPGEALYDEDMDWRNIMEELLKQRTKLAPVRLQLSNKISDTMKEYLRTQLKLKHNQIFYEKSPFDLSFAFQFAEKFADRKELLNTPQSSVYSTNVDHQKSIRLQAQKNDILLAFPFHSIRPFVRMLEEAAVDPTVVSIKITLYRVAQNSKILAALIRAAENGKEVLAILELRARFDEENNIVWSKQLEQSGCNVMYGLDEYKVHSKLLVITRRVGDKIEYLTQLGTGNYNEKTAELYTDLSIITANQEIGAQGAEIFRSLSLGEVPDTQDPLLVAPLGLRPALMHMIDEQIQLGLQGKDCGIIIKCNAVTDKGLIDKLVEASCAGVPIKLFVRGICCLRAGVVGYTENIVVKSIVGRYLEHSRIFAFGKGETQKFYISSADLMTRNTQRRIEVAAPVLDKQIANTLFKMLDMLDEDDVKARVMNSDGSYRRVEESTQEPHLDSQMAFFKMFEQEAPQSEEVFGSRSKRKEEQKGLWTRLPRWLQKWFGR